MQGSGSEPPGQHTNQGPDREQRISKKQPLKSLDKNVYHEFWFLSPTIIDLSTRFLFTTINWSPFQWKGLGYEALGQYTNQESDWIHLILVANIDFTGSSYPTINNFHFIRKILQKKSLQLWAGCFSFKSIKIAIHIEIFRVKMLAQVDTTVKNTLAQVNMTVRNILLNHNMDLIKKIVAAKKVVLFEFIVVVNLYCLEQK